MEKSQRMPQIYGYLVCLVAVITFLISSSTLVMAILDLGDPLHAGRRISGEPSLASFENYRADILRSAPDEAQAAKAGYVLDEQTLRTMYEAAKTDKIQTIRHQSNRTIVIDSVLIVICIVLFVTHWRWVQKLTATVA